MIDIEIDIEPDVFSAVAARLRADFPGIKVDSSFVSDPGTFPYVSVLEADNRIRRSMRTVKIENAVDVMYEVNVMSVRSSGRKTEAKKIANAVDQVMKALGFTRTFREQIPNFLDATVYRLVIRYEATVGEGAEEGTFLVYQN